ncbi:Type I Iterative PKS [Trichoglossum hirsutum]|uniref:Type I Iterative PKS n=1 Tax=Trichoglossum hirsutum TaxID=265104 RepID=A0A9P8RT36_9PEZI|nr:Type I Iterative PKS [Trichoglossum hirsutum]
MSPTMTGAIEEQEVLSRTGSCKSFDARADGYARGEAVNAIYVKKLSDALRDRDPIRAVIRATATNCDGKTPSIAYPSSETHEALIRRAYHVAGLHDYAETAFVECHGTGTPIGDPSEAHAIANVFGKSGVFIGSVKPNVGHSEGASGITSIIKAVLALEHKIIPPNINFLDPNPEIPFESAKLQVPVEAVPWPESRSERVSVNSFGMGGANAHAILDSAASFTHLSTAISQPKDDNLRFRLLVFSANHPSSLRKLISNYQQYVEENPSSLDDLVYTLSVRREHLSHRAFCVMNRDMPLDVSPFSKAKTPSEIVFVFTGQGAQWARMGRELIEEYSTFSDDIKAMDDILSKLPDPPGWTIQGHSSGEIAAAYACGAITAAESIIISYYGGQAMKHHKQAGGMVAVGLSRQDISPYLVDGVVIACENSPSSITLSGDEQPLDDIVTRLKVERPEALVRRLCVDMAYHSHHMRLVGEDCWSRISSHVVSCRPDIPFYSTVTGDRIDGQYPLDSNYWRRNLESPVLFNSAITAILDGSPQSTMLFVEIGPHPTLLGPLRQIFKAAGTTNAYHVSTLVRDVNGVECLLKTAGQLYLHGVPLHFPAISPAGAVLTNLPCYPWNHDKTYWSESRISREWRLRRFPHHEILGSRILEGNDVEPTWRNMLRLEDVRWIRDHVVLNDVIFPAAGYIAMAGEAIRQITGSDDYTVRRIVIKLALVLSESKETEVMTSFRPVRLTDSLDSAWYDFSILSYNGTAWTRHCVGQIREGPTQAIPNGLTTYKRNLISCKFPIEPLPRVVRSSRWHQAMKEIGLRYGPAFSGLKDISAGVKDQTAVGTISSEIAQAGSPYQLHPATIDTCLQLLSVAASRGIPRSIGQLCVPTYIEELYIRRSPYAVQAKAVASTTSKGGINGDATALAEGEIVLRLKGLRLSPLDGADAAKHLNPHTAAELDWKPDIDSIDLKGLVKPRKGLKELYLLLEKLTLLCVIETQQKLSSRQPCSSHLAKYRAWVEFQVDRAKQGNYVLVPDARDLLSLDSQGRRTLVSVTYKEVHRTEAHAVGTAILRVFEFSEDIFEGRVDPLKLLLKDNLLTRVHNFVSRWNLKELLQLLCHSKPNLKILEIGAGTGAAAAMALDDLASPHGVRMYSTYTYTDVSARFFAEAKERFKHAQSIEFATLDITKDPVEQGFEEGAYDLILAANVLSDLSMSPYRL